MAIGIVKSYNRGKGYGFITPEDGGDDVYVHSSMVDRSGMRTLTVGQRVSFEIQTGSRGLKAKDLKAV